MYDKKQFLANLPNFLAIGNATAGFSLCRLSKAKAE